MTARWVRRSAAARALGAAIVVAPLLAAIAVCLAASRWWALRHGTADGPGAALARLAVLAALGALVAVVVARVARRALPLVHLLHLTLAFPDRAPNRVGIALRANTAHSLRRAVQRGEPLPAGTTEQVAARLLALLGWLTIHDRRTRGHGDRVCAISTTLAEELDLPGAERDQLAWAAVLHDVGKLAVPTAVLNKTGPLDARERACVELHTVIGHELTEPLADWLGPYRLVPLEHHERIDGAGYPHGKAGDAISFGARLVAVADVLDVMTTARPYQRARTWDEARAELVAQSGRQFDPLVVAAVLRCGVGDHRALAAAGGAAGGGLASTLRWLSPVAAPASGGVAGVAAAVVAAIAGVLAATASPAVVAALPTTPAVADGARHRSGVGGEATTVPGGPAVASVGHNGPTAPPTATPTVSSASTVPTASTGAAAERDDQGRAVPTTPPATTTTARVTTTTGTTTTPAVAVTPTATTGPQAPTSSPTSTSTTAAPPVLAVSLPTTLPIVGTVPIVGTLPPVTVTVTVPPVVAPLTTLPVVEEPVVQEVLDAPAEATATVSTIAARAVEAVTSLVPAPALPTVPTVPSGTSRSAPRLGGLLP